jgi:hypothetical protein
MERKSFCDLIANNNNAIHATIGERINAYKIIVIKCEGWGGMGILDPNVRITLRQIVPLLGNDCEISSYTLVMAL